MTHSEVILKKYLCVDGTYFLRRAFHVTNKGVVEKVNEYTGDVEEYQDPKKVAIAFFQTLLKKIRTENYAHEVICLWDRGSWKYRPKDKFTEYKADRVYDDSFQCCWDATDLVIPLLRKLGIKSIQIPGLEADDLAMYFSHKANGEVTLFTADNDWKQCLTDTTVLHTTKEIFTLSDILQDQITHPFDIAISKAVNSKGHDNLAPVIVEDSLLENFNGQDKHNKIIDGYKQRKLPLEVMDAISRNMQLSRLDRILIDEELHSKIQEQVNLTPTKKPTNLALSIALAELGEYPAYFNGVLAKYNSIHNRG